MKSSGPVLASVIAAGIFACQPPAHAEKWSAIGLITTQIKGQEADVKVKEFEDFQTKELCVDFVSAYNKSPDYVGQGGTSGKVPRVDWNYEATCIQKEY